MNEDPVMSLLSEATRTDDPAKLRKLAAGLEHYSAWEDARLVRAKALDKEREQAEYGQCGSL